jgi:hypothetical protein
LPRADASLIYFFFSPKSCGGAGPWFYIPISRSRSVVQRDEVGHQQLLGISIAVP